MLHPDKTRLIDFRRRNRGNPAEPGTFARYDKLIEAFGGTAYYAADPPALAKALSAALAAGKPALINCPIDPKLGTESGHLGKLNPKGAPLALKT